MTLMEMKPKSPTAYKSELGSADKFQMQFPTLIIIDTAVSLQLKSLSRSEGDGLHERTSSLVSMQCSNSELRGSLKLHVEIICYVHV
jgi:hypothetical protein